MRTKKVVCIFSIVPCIPILIALLYWVTPKFCDGLCSASVAAPYLQQNTMISMHKEYHVESLNTRKLEAPASNPLEWVSVNGDDVEMSEHPDIDVRGKFQQKRLQELCRKYSFPREHQFPPGGSLRAFYRHLIFNDEHKVIYCFVPKIGCTNMKRLLLYMGGHLPLETVDWPWVEDSVYLEPALKHASLINDTLSPTEKVLRLQTYYKFMIVRNPLERLLSGYINKIEPPLKYNHYDKFPDRIKWEILRKSRHAELRYWEHTAHDKLFNISVTFTEFIRYFIDTEVTFLNEHFTPSMDICHPCLVGYNFYGNFRNYSHDAAQLIKKFQTEPRFYRDTSLHSSQDQTSKKLRRYYSQLSVRDKVQLVGTLYDELLFYYTLYPSERHSHRQVLGIDFSIV